MGITVAKLLVEIGSRTDGAVTGIRQVNDHLVRLGDGARRAGFEMSAMFTAPFLMGGKKALDMAMDYDNAMNVLQATSGASVREMEMLRAEAKALGADLTLPGTSAADAGQAMLELNKAGMDVNNVLRASRGVLQMSAAGQISNARAAGITANALNMFNLRGEEAVRVADLLAAGANASSAGVGDMADSLKMAGSVFAAAGQPIEDLTTMIAQMANAGIVGSDAGTSLKQMMLSLQAPTDKSKDLMRELGLRIYDASGAMLPAEEIIRQFSSRLGELTEEQRNTALATIFGSDAVRSANVVLMGGAEAFREMKEAVTEQGAAAELAGAQMKGLKGAFENLTSATETAMLAGIEPFKEDIINMAGVVTDAANAFGELDVGMQKAIVAGMGLTAATGPALLAMGSMAKVTANVGNAFMMVPGAIGKATTAMRAWQAGATVTNGLVAAGLSSTVVTLGAVGLAVGAVTAAWAQWNKQIVQTNREGVEAVEGTWADFFEKQIEAGADAADMMAAYQAAQAEMNRTMEEANPLARMFVNEQGIMQAGTEALSNALVQTANGYDEYMAMMRENAAAMGMEVDERGNLVKVTMRMGKAHTELIQKNYMLSESEHFVARDTLTLNGALSSTRKELEAAGMGVDSFSQSVDELTGATEAAIESELTLAEAKEAVSDSVTLADRAYKAHMIGIEQYAVQLQAAEAELMRMAEAEGGNMELMVEAGEVRQKLADATRELAEKASEARMANLGLAESYKTMTNAQMAVEMFEQIKAAAEADGVVTQQEIERMRALGVEMGAVTESGLLFADSSGAVAEAMLRNIIPQGQAEEAIRKYNEAVQSADFDMRTFLEGMGIPESLVGKFMSDLKKTEDSAGGMAKGATEAGDGIETMGEKMSGMGELFGTAGELMAGFKEDNLVPFEEAWTHFNEFGLTKVNEQFVAMKDDAIPGLAVVFGGFVQETLVPFEEMAIKLADEVLAGLTSSFGDLVGKAGAAKSAVDKVKAALDKLPASKTVDVFINVHGEVPKIDGGGDGGGGKSAHGRASGGPVAAHTPYIVGERGPELFVPGSSGTIVPNDKLGGAMGNSYQQVVNVTPQKANIDAGDLAALLRVQAMKAGMRL